ncbi:MAG TPA: hypothetical protein VMA74_01435 [Dyella sp.]|uniref:YXWGXW repeat-containing protein n=1 Tax=Dyella sp. TaxID=1869338 RepID=UPI002C945D2D|nr:hypothetical protein [Dyella sp.]HUB88371.1 hypothetical protein [Dyella sp.]
MKAISLTQHLSTKRMLVRALAGLLGAVAALAALPQKADAGVFIGVGVSVGVPPPPLPIYEQPPIPGPGYIWTPGYWAWDGAEYYWVPGTWVIAPFYGALWTPAYWGWDDGFYAFHPGYWGYHVGFYGGIHYGFGYNGNGYDGGYWGRRGFYYNRAVNHIDNVNITNVYNRSVIDHGNRVSYNGGRGGIIAHATPGQMAYARESRMGPIAAQRQQMALASHDPAMRASFNHGNPPIAATQRPGAFNGGGVMPAHGSRFTPAAFNTQRVDNNVMHAPQAMQPRSGVALRSANFAPHAYTPARPNLARPSGSYSHLYRPGNVTAATPVNHAFRPAMNGYRGPATVYHPAPVYRAAPAYHPQYRAPAPQIHAYHAAPAARGGGGRQPHHG